MDFGYQAVTIADLKKYVKDPEKAQEIIQFIDDLKNGVRHLTSKQEVFQIVEEIREWLEEKGLPDLKQ